MAKLEAVVQHALRTFRRASKILPEPLPNDLTALKTLADDITLKDLKLPKFLLQKTELHQFLGKKLKAKIDPVEYLCMYEDADVSIGVFILKQGAKLPIHDHPCMYGILKVLQGIIKVTSYSVVGVDSSSSLETNFFYQHPLKAIKHPETTVSELDGCCTLTPTERGIHEVECVSGPALFLDILAPPYEEEDNFSKPRGCHYFEEVKLDNVDDEYVRLVQISNPSCWALPKEEKETINK